MAEKSIFGRLKTLFSSDVIIRNVGGDQLKVADVNQIQTTGKYQTNALVDRFSRLFLYNNKNIFNPNLNYQTLRIQLYSDYEAMDTDPLITSTLDIMADEITLKNERGEVLSVNSDDEKIQKVLYNLFYDILNIEFNLWSWARGMLKYGDYFLKLEIAEDYGVYNVIPYTVYNMVRFEGRDEDNPSKVEFQIDPDGLASSSDPNYIPRDSKSVIKLDNYEVAHFRLISDTNYLPYGRSYIEPARKIFKQLALMEDAMLIHRIMRAPEKRTFYVNVGTLPSKDIDQFMQKTVDSMKKTPYVDPETGQYNLRFNMQNMMEDFYIPVRNNDASTKIETTKGLEYDGTNDIEYLRDKMFAALKVPKAYFGYEGDLSGKATLAAEDIRFARNIERVQRIIESELTKIALVHLYTQGFRGSNLTNFNIKLTNPSVIYEQEKIALMQDKIDLVKSMQETEMFSSDYIYDTLFDMSEHTYKTMRDQIRFDKQRAFRLSQLENEGNDPQESGVSYGTPHDLAHVYRSNNNTSRDTPEGYSNDLEGMKDMPNMGRPKEKTSFVNTQEDPLGRDRLGKKDMEGGYPSDSDIKETTNRSEGNSESGKREYDNKTAKSMYTSVIRSLKDLSKKEMVFEGINNIQSGSIMDESILEDNDDFE